MVGITKPLKLHYYLGKIRANLRHQALNIHEPSDDDID